MSIPKGMIVLRPYGSVEVDNSPEMKELIKRHNAVKDIESLEKNISDHKGYVDKMMARLGIRKQEPESEPEAKPKAEPEPKPKDQKDMVDQKSILEVITTIAETLSDHAEVIESLSDRVDALEQKKSTKRQGDFALRGQASEADLQVIQSRFEAIGLTGEVVKVIRNPYIQGRFND